MNASADGYYAQFCIDVEREAHREPTGKTIGLDVGLTHFYTDSNGQTVENPRHLRKSLSQRTHRCQHCGLVKDRDPNAAINILELALHT